jgi:hypothetical protein
MTTRIFSSVQYFFRVARRMVLIGCSASIEFDRPCGPDFCLIFASLMGYDKPEILLSVHPVKCPEVADGGHAH